MCSYFPDESLSRVAKEEQYRHADEEMGTSHKHKKPRVFDLQAPANGFPPVQMPLYPAPVDQAMINAATPVQQQETTPMETQTVLDPQTVFQNISNFESAQQITREHLQRDKHLWTLLQSQYNSTSINDSGVSTDPGSSSSNGSARGSRDVSMRQRANSSSLEVVKSSARFIGCCVLSSLIVPASNIQAGSIRQST